MCLAQGPQRSDAGEAWTRGPSVSSQALYHWSSHCTPYLAEYCSLLNEHFHCYSQLDYVVCCGVVEICIVNCLYPLSPGAVWCGAIQFAYLLFACCVIFSCFCCRLLTFFIINFKKKFFQECYQSVKQFKSRSGPTERKSVLIWVQIVCQG